VIYANTTSGITVSELNSGVVDGVTIYNNVIYGNGNESGHGINLSNGVNIVVKNNILKENRPNTSAYRLQLYMGTEPSADGGTVIDYNWYHHSTATVRIYRSGGYETLAAFKIAGYEAGTTGGESDPLFANATSYDFRLKPGSPCINTGTDVSLTTDYLGQTVPCRGVVDIGAIEACYHLWLVGE
jgi:hypothetical protein